MLLSLLTPITRTVSTSSRRFFSARRVNPQMSSESLSLIQKRKHANFRVINVSGFKTDLMEIPSHDPALHVLFIPGNPDTKRFLKADETGCLTGVISFYTDFLELLYESLGGVASVTGKPFNSAALSHEPRNWESGRLFSLQEQIDHKVKVFSHYKFSGQGTSEEISFIEQELQDVEVPIVLVGHSIGSYISLEISKRSQEKVVFCIGLYPFLALNTASKTQASIRRLAEYSSSLHSRALSSFLSGLQLNVLQSVSWGLVGYAASSDFKITVSYYPECALHGNDRISEEKPDWDFIRGKKNQIAFLFGLDDHWGPLHIYEEIRKQAPDARLEVEREGHTHAFSCTEAGSVWVAQHVSSLIRSYIQTAKSYQSRM
ncbi:Lipid droplet-associated hydrolase [Sesamum angolense]|uniref:Lipid droplet-associated hydrolase n=1 Tax=Sesamum angolense TaxID=2727404 RepID=A0AAE1WET8_9LAMI|nr:Lipid droplet-associated hydrolase [Sesamum angolense]